MRIDMKNVRALVLVLLITGCASVPHGNPDLLTFLQSGATPKQEVLLKLGQPSGKFDEGKVLTYRLAQDKGGYYVSGRSSRSTSHGWPLDSHCGYSLVLVFDDQNVLRTHSVVNVMMEEAKK